MHTEHELSVEIIPCGTLTLLELLRSAGLSVSAPCGGAGRCGGCRTEIETSAGREIVRACGYIPRESVRVYLPRGGGILTARTENAAPIIAEGESPLCGAAVDLGTTTIAVSLVRLSDSASLGSVGAWNTQGAWGADVITRTQYIIEHPDGLTTLRDAVRGQIADMISELSSRTGARVERFFLCGNTIMQHIAAGLDPRSIALCPYTPVTLFADGAADHWPELPASVVYAPCVSGYIGGDITAGLLSIGLHKLNETALFMDIGTNGEIVLRHHGRFLCCSTACGPAFEGAGITCGSRSVPGAVCGVSLSAEGLALRTVDDAPARSLCGSGLLDLAAILLQSGIIDEGGRLLPPDEAEWDCRIPALLSHLRADDRGSVFNLTPDGCVCLTAGDVRQLQLAKAACAAGIRVLLDHAGLTAEQVQHLYLAGGFGSAMRPASAEIIGLIPRALSDRVTVLGSSALSGAQRVLWDAAARRELANIPLSCDVIELSGNAAFSAAYIDAMLFDTNE